MAEQADKEKVRLNSNVERETVRLIEQQAGLWGTTKGDALDRLVLLGVGALSLEDQLLCRQQEGQGEQTRPCPVSAL